MSAAEATSTRFHAARPIWPVGREREMNCFVGFRAVLPASRLSVSRPTLRLAASTLYRAFLNGRFLGCGPARAAHGHARVDEWDLSPHLEPGDNLLAIEVAGYNVNSYYTLDEPAFLQAEVVSEAGGDVIAATGADSHDFRAVPLDDHVQKVERYSAARAFSEVLDLRPDCYAWRDRLAFSAPPRLACAASRAPELVPRRVPYPLFDIASPARQIGAGAIERITEPVELRRDWTLTCIGPDLKGYPEAELSIVPSLELQRFRSIPDTSFVPRAAASALPLTLGSHRFATFDFTVNGSGFLRARFTCERPSRVVLAFDEILTEGEVSISRLRCVNAIWIEAQPGTYEVETFEPYSLRYLKLMCLGGGCRIERVELRRYEHPPVLHRTLDSGDERLERIYAAGVATFRPNAVDLPTDCPSRERSAWLCDSFYTCRAAFELTGSTALEQSFLENYLLPEQFEYLPDGMVPMNYPADHPNGKFIPNWALWLVLQLEEYLARSGDRSMIEAFRPRVEKLFDYFARFHDEFGLLERLESWIFVEWSRANDFVQDVNYPTNMLYAAALDAAGRVYRREDWSRQARRVREVVNEQSFDGSFFIDNAVRTNGRIERTANRTEVCQYHAFYFGIASPVTHPQLWRTLVSGFGPRRAVTKAYPDVYPANALMGYTMRLELLVKHGLVEQMRDEILAWFLPMAEATGTLWEHGDASASCNHGFASHVCCLLRQSTGDATLR